MGDKVEGVYCRGDLVFAKVRGYPPWRARVSNMLEVNDEAENSSGSPYSSDFQVEGLACKSSKEVKYSVLFFGTFERAACTESNLFHYEHHKEKYGNSRRRGFEESLQQIEEAAREVPLNHADIEVKEEVMDTEEASHTEIKSETVSPLSENLSCDESVDREAIDVDWQVTASGAYFVVKEEAIDAEETSLSEIKREAISNPSDLIKCEDPVKDETVDVNMDLVADINDEIDIHEDFFPLPETDVPVTMGSPKVEVIKSGANFVVKEEAIDTEETPLSKFEEETASSPSNLLCEDPVKDETVDVNLVYEQQSTAHMTAPSEHHCSTPETCEINSAYLMSRISIQNKSEEAHRENGELLKGCSRESPQEGCSDTAASYSCSVEPLRVQDVEENDQSEKCSRKCSGVGERRPKKSMPCNRETQSSSSNKTSSKQSGRQKETRKRFCCDTCCKCFLSMVHLENHKRKHTGEKPFCCALCNNACATKNNLTHHMKVNSEGGPYKCSSCDKSFKESGSLKSHMRLHSGGMPFCCSLCNKTFSTKNYLAHHLKVHSEERPYKCSTCNKSFKRGHDLVEHMRLHSGEKPFECRVCKKAFTQSTHLTTHMRTHTGKKPFKCTECGKAFTHSGALTRHMRLHSGGKPFVCTECGKAFTRSDALTCHMRLHSGEKPFVCTECGKAFTQSCNLHTHMRTHTGERLFHCKNCESSFTQSSNLTRHRRLVHGVASPVS